MNILILLFVLWVNVSSKEVYLTKLPNLLEYTHDPMNDNLRIVDGNSIDISGYCCYRKDVNGFPTLLYNYSEFEQLNETEKNIKYNGTERFEKFIPVIARIAQVNNETIFSEYRNLINFHGRNKCELIFYHERNPEYEECRENCMNECLVQTGKIWHSVDLTHTNAFYYTFEMCNQKHIKFKGTFVHGSIMNLPRLYDNKQFCIFGYCSNWYAGRKYNKEEYKNVQNFMRMTIALNVSNYQKNQ